METCNGSTIHNNSSLSSAAELPLRSENNTIRIIKLFCYSAVFFVGLIGNVITFWLVLRKRKLQTVSNYLLLSLTVADLGVLLIALPFRLAYQENDYVWPFGPVLCKIIPALIYLSLTASSGTLLVMSLDRHRAIAHPFKQRLQKSGAFTLIGVIWLVSVLSTLPLMLTLQIVVRRGREICTDVWPNRTLERAYFIFIFVLQFILPMMIMAWTFVGICKKLKNSRLLVQTLGDRIARRNKKVVKMLSVIVIVYATFTLPYHVTWLLSQYDINNSLAKQFCALLVIAMSATHPVIYGTLHEDFAKGFKAYLLRCNKGYHDKMTKYLDSMPEQETNKISRKISTALLRRHPKKFFSSSEDGATDSTPEKNYRESIERLTVV